MQQGKYAALSIFRKVIGRPLLPPFRYFDKGSCVERLIAMRNSGIQEAEQAKALGFDDVIDTSLEKLVDGVRRITDGYGADIIIDGIGGEVLSEAVKALAPGGSLITLGYSASRKTTIDVTSLIVSQTSIRGFNMFSQPQETVTDAWKIIVSLLQSGAIKPIVAKTFPLAEAAEALRYLVEGRPFGRVVLTV
jgi:NADPH2:quinone reductase